MAGITKVETGAPQGQLYTASMVRQTSENFTSSLTDFNAETEIENKLNKLRLDHYAELFEIIKNNMTQIEVDKQKAEFEIEKKLAEQKRLVNKEQFDAELQRGLAAIDAEYKAEASFSNKAAKAKEKKQAEFQKQLEKQWKKDQDYKDKLEKATRVKNNKETLENIKKQAEEAGLAGKAYTDAVKQGLEAAGISKDDLKEMKSSDAKAKAKENTAKVATAILDFAKNMDSTIQSIASAKSLVDTRLQGSTKATKEGSYWSQMSESLTTVAGVSPLVKQADVATNLKSMISSGIAFNVEQRAFLATIKDKIADTFDATNGTLLRLIRIQQQDSTASRLGMESAITAFLNNMYENTEYLQSIATEVRSNIEEASALMSATDAVGFEYQVQKWMGSLYSAGFSKTSNISSALGKLAAGDISGLTGDATGNLMIMAANQAGLPLGEILAEGLDESNTNKLMQAMVNYLGGIYNDSKGSLVVQQQMANVYGLAASDLKAASTVMKDVKAISGSSLNYDQGLGRLTDMANTMASRISQGELMETVFDNLKYTMASGIASSTALYGIWSGTKLLDMIGGISIPALSYLGTGVDLNTTVSDLIKVGALGTSAGLGIGKIAAAGNLLNNFSGSGMLNALGIGTTATVSRGSGDIGLTRSGVTTSNSTTLGSDSSLAGDKALADSQNDANQQLKVKEQESTEVTISTVNSNVVEILSLLQHVVDGTSPFVITEAYKF